MPNDSEDQKILGIRMPDDLRSKVKTASKLEDRTESSFARHYLSKAADEVISAHQEEATP